MSRQQRDPKRDIEWHFFSFPVAFAFFLGAFISTLLYPLGFFVFFISLFGVSFGLAHIAGHWYRKRVTDRAKQKADEDERERRALAARAANSQQGAAMTNARRRRRRRRGSAGPSNSADSSGE